MYNIAVLPGDGTGPEMIREGIKVLKAAQKKFSFKLNFTELPYGGEHYLKTGETLTEQALENLKKFDAIYLGAIGHPKVKPGILEKEILLKIRFKLDQYINLRPVKLYPGVETPIKNKGPEDIDFVVVRKTRRALCRLGRFFKKILPMKSLFKSPSIRARVLKEIRYAFELCRKRNKMKNNSCINQRPHLRL